MNDASSPEEGDISVHTVAPGGSCSPNFTPFLLLIRSDRETTTLKIQM